MQNNRSVYLHCISDILVGMANYLQVALKLLFSTVVTHTIWQTLFDEQPIAFISFEEVRSNKLEWFNAVESIL